ncbi:tryptophan-rich sensory protein [Brachybacterium avium]|uniref:tryptophan-rich sensory protein n=1 Tax=Brachybacterium avium TaxID=2017485 RepID=UPI001FE3C16A|nr:tryptophan-rich sensory protein [Brachybacterium avium]
MTRSSRPLVRHLAVSVSFLLAMVGTAIGVGAFGGDPIDEAAGGLLAADATHLAPAGSAFMIWSVIYVGLGAFTLWQWWDRRDARRIAPQAIASLLLNAAWILTIQAGWVALSVVVIVLLLAVLADLFRRLTAVPPGGGLERIVVDGTFGLYLGWVSVATCANIAAALTGAGFSGFGVPSLLAVAVLAVVAVIGVALTVAGRRPVAAPLAMIWGLAWIAVGRATDEPHAPAVAIAAGVAAAVIALAAAAQWVLPHRRGAAATTRTAPATAGRAR